MLPAKPVAGKITPAPVANNPVAPAPSKPELPGTRRGSLDLYNAQLERMKARGMDVSKLLPEVVLPQRIGYNPTFWEDPQRVARWYHVVTAAPPGWQAPNWLDTEKLTRAYDYFAMQNSNKPWTEWKYLNAADPGRGYLQSQLQVPPDDFLWPQDRGLAAATVNAVQQGQSAWSNLSEDQRQSILTDPNFDIAKWDYKVRGEMLADPNFDWSRVPWQETYYKMVSSPKVMASPMALAGMNAGKVFGPFGALAGAAFGYGLGLVGQQYDQTAGVWQQKDAAATLMALLNRASEYTEQGSGFTGQVLDAALAGETDAATQMITDADRRRAAWEAARSSYEVSGLGRYESNLMAMSGSLPTAGKVAALLAQGKIQEAEKVAAEYIRDNPLAGPGEDFIVGRAEPVPMYQGEGHSPITGADIQVTDSMGVMQDWRLRIDAAIEAGASEAEIDAMTNEMLMEVSQFIGGQVADLTLQSAIDPLNFSDKIQSLGGELVFKGLAQAAGDTPNGKAFAAMSQAFTDVDGLTSAKRRYETIMRFVPQDEIAAMDGMAGKIMRYEAGLNTEGKVRAGPFTNQAILDTSARTTGKRGFIDWITKLTPESRARIGLSLAYDNIRAIFSQFDDPADIAKFWHAVAGGDVDTAKAMAGSIVGSPEWATVLPAMKDFAKMGDLLAVWEASADKRAMLLRVAELMKIEPARLVDKLGKASDVSRMFQVFKDKLAAMDSPQAKAMLDDINAGLFTPENLKSIADIFSGKEALPWHPDQWKAMVSDAIGTHFGEWATAHLGLKPDSKFFRLAATLKSAQLLLLLGFNPSYMVNNAVNNVVTRAATGMYGFLLPNQIKDWMDRFGVDPYRMNAGVGVTGEGFSTQGGERAITDATRGKGIIATVQRVLKETNNKVGAFSRMSQGIEKMESRQAFAISMRDMWGKLWRRGVGFSRLDPTTTSMLRAIRPDAPDLIYSAIEAGMNKTEIENAIYNRQGAVSAREYIHNAANKLGISPQEAAMTLDKLGVLDRLDVLLQKARTPAEIRNAFRNVDRFAQEHMEIQRAQELPARMVEVANRIDAEGAPAAMDILADTISRNTDTWLEHYVTFGDVFEKIDQIPEAAMRDRLLRDARLTNMQRWTKANAWEMTTYRGLMEALKWDKSPEIVDFMRSLDDVNRVKGDTYKAQLDAVDAWNQKWQGQWDNPARWDEWTAMNAEFDKQFRQMFRAEHDGMLAQGDAMGKAIEARYGKAAADAFRKGWADVVRFRDAMVSKVHKFRADAARMSHDDRQAAKAKFYQNEYPAMIVQFGDVRKMFGEDLQAAIQGLPPKSPKGTGGVEAKPVQTDLFAQEAAEEVARYDAETLAEEANIAKIASDHGMPSADENGQPLPSARLDLIKFVKKYGGSEGAHLRTWKDLAAHPEIVERAFTNRDARVQAQAELFADRPDFTKPTTPEGKPTYWDEKVKYAVDSGIVDPELTRQIRDIPIGSRTELEQKALDQSAEYSESLAYIDGKLGINNRNAYESAVKAGSLPPVQVMVDLNFLKTVNDAASHALGDDLLHAFATLAHDTAPDNQHVYRIGGDEFVIAVNSEAEAASFLAKAKDLARQYILSVPVIDPATKAPVLVGGKIQYARIDGLRFEAGIGRTLGEADGNLQLAKSRPEAAKRAGYPTDATIGIAPDGWKPALRHQDSDLTATEVQQTGVGSPRTGDGSAGQGTNGNLVEKPTQIDYDQLHRDGILLSLTGDEGRSRTFKDFGEYHKPLVEPLTDAFNEMLRQAGESPEKAPRSLLQAIKDKGGIRIDQMRDITGETKTRKGIPPGLFAKNGMPLDTLAQALVEDGYILQNVIDDPMDNGGINTVSDMIRRAVGGEKIYPMGELMPDWVKRAGGSSEAARLVGQIMAGVEDPASKRVQSIKSDAFQWVTDNIQEYQDARQYLRIPFDERSNLLIQQIDDLEARIPGLAGLDPETGLAAINTWLDDYLATNLPEDMPDGVWQRRSDLLERIYPLESEYRLKAESNRATATAQANADRVMTRKVYEEQLRETAHLTDEQIAATMTTMEGVEKWYQRVTGRPGEDVYKYYSGMTGEGTPSDLMQQSPFSEVWYSKAERTITDKMPNREGQPLFQDIKGGVTFLPDKSAILHFFDKADISTVVHENAHVWRRLMQDIAKNGNIEAQTDLTALEKWAGVKDGNWTVDAEEKFARGFERYLTEGKAPTPALVRVFENFKRWMLEIYKTITGSPIDIEITPEVRDVFDRLMGKEPMEEPATIARPEQASLDIMARMDNSLNAFASRLKNDGWKISNKKPASPAGETQLREGGYWGFRAEENGSIIEDTFMLPMVWAKPPKSVTDVRLFLSTYLDAYNSSIVPELARPLPSVLHQIGDIVRLSDGTQATITNVRPDATLELDNGRVVSAAAVERVAAQENMFGDMGLKAGPDVQQTTLFQSADPRMPFGGYDEMAGTRPESQIMQEGWEQQVRPLLAAMEEEAVRRAQQQPLQIGDADDATQAALRKYLNRVYQDQAAAKLQTVRWGESQRDFALLNYNRRYGFDKLLDIVFPYQFWYTRSMMNWASRAIDKPGLMAFYSRIRMAQNRYENNIPERLRGKMAIPTPYLPDEWMGDTLYIDPLRQLFPFAQLLKPLETMNRDKTYQIQDAERLLQEWASEGKITPATATEAAQTRAGSTWDEAIAEAKLNRESEISNPFDFMNVMLGPAWYLSTPYKALTGKKDEISQLPLTRTANAAQAVMEGTPLQPVGDLLGMFAKPEDWMRQQAGMPQNGEYGDYYIDRQLANMVADGQIDPQTAQQAMIERSGPAFDMATKRVKLELAVRVPGAATLYALLHGAPIQQVAASVPASMFGAGILPAGELRFRGLTDKWNAAWDKFDAGDKNAIQSFFDEYPEYEAYIARKKTPEERLRNFLVGQVWDRYMALDKAGKRMVRAQMGDLFQQAFLDTNTRDYTALDVDTLALWTRYLGGVVPKTDATQNVTSIPQAQMETPTMLPPNISTALQAWEAERDSRFPGILDVQSMYYGLPEIKRDAFLVNYPELNQYRTWRKQYIASHPDLRPFIDSYYAQDILSGKVDASQETLELLKLYYSEDYQDPLYGAADYLKDASPILWEQLFDYQLFHQRPSEAAMTELRTIWEASGEPAGTLQKFLNEIIMPTLGQ